MRDDDAIRWDAREAAMIESHRFRFGDLLVEHPAKRLERIVRNRFDVSLDAGVVEKDVHAAATSCSRLTSATTDSASAEAGSVPMARASPASSRSTATMRAPRSAKSWMVAVPISPAAPVTRATFPFSTRSVMSCQSSPMAGAGRHDPPRHYAGHPDHLSCANGRATSVPRSSPALRFVRARGGTLVGFC